MFNKDNASSALGTALHSSSDRRDEFRHLSAVLLLLAVALALFLPGFSSLPPVDRDEPRFAQASKQMLESRDFVDIRFQAEARNKKPVGVYWLQAAAVFVGDTIGLRDARRLIWLYRVPSLIGALATVLGTYWAALALTTRRGALLSALLMASTVLLNVEARLAKTDALTAATVVFAMGALARVYRRHETDAEASGSASTAALFWTSVGIGILIKGPITPMIPALAALALVIQQRSGRWLLRLHPLRGLAWVALIALPWYVLIVLRTKGMFLSEAIGHDMLGKVAGGQEAHGAPPGAYLAAFWASAWPMASFVAPALSTIWSRWRHPPTLFLLAWIVPAWLLFEAIPTKLPQYVMPLYPAISILAGAAAARSWELDRVSKSFAFVASLLAALMPIGIGVALLRGQGLLWTALSWTTILAGSTAIVSLGLCATAAGLFLARRRSGAAIGAVLVASFCAYVFVLGHLLTPAVSDQIDLSARLAAAARAALGTSCDAPALVSAGDHEPSLVFLTDTTIVLTTGAGAADFLNGGGPCRAALVSAGAEPSFRATLSDVASVKVVQRISGTLINGGKRLDIGIYVRQGERP